MDILPQFLRELEIFDCIFPSKYSHSYQIKSWYVFSTEIKIVQEGRKITNTTFETKNFVHHQKIYFSYRNIKCIHEICKFTKPVSPTLHTYAN